MILKSILSKFGKDRHESVLLRLRRVLRFLHSSRRGGRRRRLRPRSTAAMHIIVQAGSRMNSRNLKVLSMVSDFLHDCQGNFDSVGFFDKCMDEFEEAKKDELDLLAQGYRDDEKIIEDAIRMDVAPL